MPFLRRMFIAKTAARPARPALPTVRCQPPVKERLSLGLPDDAGHCPLDGVCGADALLFRTFAMGSEAAAGRGAHKLKTRNKMGKELLSSDKNLFEQIKRTDENGNESWSARNLSKILEYSEYRHFLPVVERAKEACGNSGQILADHFEDILEMVTLGSGAKRKIENIKLSRYACYLIVQNADPAKEVVALGQTYFAIQTRKQEIQQMEAYTRLTTEEEKRVFLRDELKKHNTSLASTAEKAGVQTSLDYAIFQNHGYKGLYGGLDAKGIHKKKSLRKNQQILDHMGSTELAANLFRATQTEEKLRNENIQGKAKANQTHYQVGTKVRQTIEELGGTMPENLPVAENIKAVQKKLKNTGRKKLTDTSNPAPNTFPARKKRHKT